MAGALKEVIVYTDGGCEPNPGLGGYGAVLVYGRARREISGGFRLTTNNRMELLAAVRALECLRERCRVRLHSDSQYLVRAMETGAVAGWKAKGFRRRGGKLVPNADIWEQLLALCERHDVEFRWVKGHDGNAMNERCDQLASAALRAGELAVDDGYEKSREGGEAEEALFGESDAGADRSAAAEVVMKPPSESRKITQAGEPCRKCQTPVVKRMPRAKARAGQSYYFEWYLYCPGCRTMYMVEEAKRPFGG